MIPVCPKCDTALFSLTFQSVEVDYCDSCRGVWLDAGELEELGGPTLSLLQLPADNLPAGKKHLCPRCDAALHEVRAPSNLTLDRCPQGHGLWFDAKELPQLLATPAGTSLHAIFNQGEKP